MSTEYEKRMHLMALIIISLYSPKVTFKKHLELIKNFIVEMIDQAIKSDNEIAIENLSEFNELFDYFIESERLKIELIEIERLLESGDFQQERGAELLFDSIKWHSQFETIMKQMKGRENYKVFESFYKELMNVYHKVTNESNELIEVIKKAIDEVEQNI